jgi:hypothetical protein
MFQIREVLDQMMREKINTLEHRSNWASLLGDDCPRKLTYFRVSPHEARIHTVELQYLFDNGDEEHNIAIQRLRNTGKFRIRGTEIPIPDKPEYKKYNIGGKIDVRIQDEVTKEIRDGEIKTMSENMFNSINCIADLEKHHWYKKYLTQLGLYMKIVGSEEGFFLIAGRMGYKVFWVTMDIMEPFAQKGLKNAEIVEENLKNNTLPERVLTDACMDCPFFNLCLPSLKDLGGKMIPYEGPQLADTIEKYVTLEKESEEAKKASKELEKLKDRIKISVMAQIKATGRQTGDKTFKIVVEDKYLVKAQLMGGTEKKKEYLKIKDIVDMAAPNVADKEKDAEEPI